MGKLKNIDGDFDVILANKLTAYATQLKNPNPYPIAISEFCCFIGHPAGLKGWGLNFLRATEEQAAAYMEWQKEQTGDRPKGFHVDHDHPMHKRAQSTIRKNATNIRKFYKILTELGIAKRNPFSMVRIPTHDGGLKRESKLIPYNKVKSILKAPDKNTNRGIRDRAILAIMFGGGLRVSEVTKLNIGDYREENHVRFLYLKLRKSGRDDRQPLPTWALKALDKWVKIRKGEPEDPLFTPMAMTREHALSAHAVRILFKKYCCRVGLDPDLYNSHCARVTATCKLLADGKSISDVRDFTGHSDVNMVLYYDKRRRELEDSLAHDLDF